MDGAPGSTTRPTAYLRPPGAAVENVFRFRSAMEKSLAIGLNPKETEEFRLGNTGTVAFRDAFCLRGLVTAITSTANYPDSVVEAIVTMKSHLSLFLALRKYIREASIPSIRTKSTF